MHPRSSALTLTLICALILPFAMGVNGCPSAGGDDDEGGGGGVDVPDADWDAFVTEAAEDLAADGDRLSTDPTTPFGTCIYGVVIQGIGDGTIFWGVPIKQAVERGETSGQLGEFVIDPSICVGRDGTPETPDELDAARAEVEGIFDVAAPAVSMALQAGSFAAMTQGDTTSCVRLKLASDLLEPGGEFLVQVLKVIETPGSDFHVPGPAWDAGWCL